MDGATRTTGSESGIVVRRLTIALALLAGACAQPGLPPGGPVDTAAPKILRVRPDSNRINVRTGSVTIDFDEVVSERPQGATNLAALFVISPSSGENSASWRRATVSISPRGGFRPGITYTVRMLPGMTDLDGNVDSTGLQLVFSTGPAIARSNIRGIVFDWVAEKNVRDALVEAIALPATRDSIRYLAVADSLGRFDLQHVPPGRYFVRALVDQNKNRLLDPRELYDSATVTLGDSLRREMLAIVRDTLGPNIQTITVSDSLTLRVAFDHLLDSAQTLTPALFSVTRADSVPLRIASVMSVRAFDKAKEDSLKLKAQRDSIRRDSILTDSLRKRGAAKPDSAPARPAPPRTTPTPRPRRTDIPTAVANALGRDTTRRDSLPKPSMRPPISDVIIKLAQPLEAGKSYRLRTLGLRSFLGHQRSALRAFNTPKPEKKDSTSKDSSRTRRDSTRRDTTSRDTIRQRSMSSHAPAPNGSSQVSGAMYVLNRRREGEEP